MSAPAPIRRSKLLARLGRGFEIWSGIGVAFAAVSLAFADIFGLLERPAFQFISDKIPAITLLALGGVLAMLLFERATALESTREHLRTLVDRIDLMARDQELVTSFFGVGQSEDAFNELRLVAAARRLRSLGDRNSIRVAADEVLDMWLQALSLADTFVAFNYVRDADVWGTGWAKSIAQASQERQIAVGCAIKRLFVLDSKEELTSLASVMSTQAAAGIAVGWILKDQVLANSALTDVLYSLRTWDLVAINDDIVMKVFLDDNRHIRSAELVRDRVANSRVRHVFLEGFAMAERVGVPEA